MNGGSTVSTPARQTSLVTDIERGFALQQAHQWEAKASTAEQRKEKLRKLKAAVEAHAEQIMAAVKQDTRKPEGEIKVTEVLGVLGNIQKNIDSLDEWMKPVEVVPSANKDDKARIVYEARGVCLILGPWNFPLGLTIGPLAAAIAAGNCCMVSSPTSARRPHALPARSSARRSTRRRSRCSKAASTWPPHCSSCRSATSSSRAVRGSESW